MAPCRWRCRWDQGQGTQAVHPRPISSICPQVAGCTPPWTPRRQAPARNEATAPKQVRIVSQDTAWAHGGPIPGYVSRAEALCVCTGKGQFWPCPFMSYGCPMSFAASAELCCTGCRSCSKAAAAQWRHGVWAGARLWTASRVQWRAAAGSLLWAAALGRARQLWGPTARLEAPHGSCSTASWWTFCSSSSAGSHSVMRTGLYGRGVSNWPASVQLRSAAALHDLCTVAAS